MKKFHARFHQWRKVRKQGSPQEKPIINLSEITADELVVMKIILEEKKQLSLFEISDICKERFGMKHWSVVASLARLNIKCLVRYYLVDENMKYLEEIYIPLIPEYSDLLRLLKGRPDDIYKKFQYIYDLPDEVQSEKNSL